MSDEFVRVSTLHELTENKGIARKLEDNDIALVKLNGKVFAFVNVCPHQHTPLIDKYGGQITENNLTCPMHGWTYDLNTGECVNVPPCPKGIHSDGIPHSNEMSIMSGKSGKLKMLEVKVEGGNVFVRKFVRNQNW